MPFELPKLEYGYDALEPYIDAKTMEIHHSKHHAAYTEKFNAAIKENGLDGKSAEEIFMKISKYPTAVRNNGGGYYNHNLYWSCMAPNAGGEPKEALIAAINKDFGSFDKFKEEFGNAGLNRFGSGWAWLIFADGKLKVTSTPNQDNPLMDTTEVKGYPLLCMDVWEHAYYLKYQNKRADYISNFWNVINWPEIEKRYVAQSEHSTGR
ncbi:MAG: superoxide dismutase [Candidatus Gracilibacteria bacterium]|jgi:Fe-Mn family superoxide dismutase